MLGSAKIAYAFDNKRNRICKISNVIVSVLYIISAWIFTVLGVMLFSLGLPDKFFPFIWSFTSAFLCSITPIFCVLGIALSIRLRKKYNYVASFWVQFIPFGTLGVASVSFLLLICTG